MKDRIILLIKAKNLTAAQFADEIGVQKSSISHIISGRNNASLDFIQKVLICYPDVSMDWLMFGKGPIFKGMAIAADPNNDGHSEARSTPLSAAVDLFSGLNPVRGTEFSLENNLSLSDTDSEKEKIADISKGGVLSVKENKPVHNDESEVKVLEKQKITSEHTNTSTKSIIKIVEFYSDNTYREFFPE